MERAPEARLAGPVVLLSADGVGTNGIMAATSTAKTTVWRCQERLASEGVDGLLRDKTRPPGKAPVPPEQVAELVRLTLAPPPHEATHWTAQAMAKVVGLAISPHSDHLGRTSGRCTA